MYILSYFEIFSSFFKNSKFELSATKQKHKKLIRGGGILLYQLIDILQEIHEGKLRNWHFKSYATFLNCLIRYIVNFP